MGRMVWSAIDMMVDEHSCDDEHWSMRHHRAMGSTANEWCTKSGLTEQRG